MNTKKRILIMLLSVTVLFISTVAIGYAKPKPRKNLHYTINKPTNLTAKEFTKILKGTKLSKCGNAYYNLEKKYKINGIYAIAVSGLESGYGKHQSNRNNIYGMRGGRGWMRFSNKTACINYFGQLMNKPLYKGKSIHSVSRIYCEQSYQWERYVKNLMRTNWIKLRK